MRWISLVGWNLLPLVALAQSPAAWKQHDMSRPRPAMVSSTLQLPIPAPSDAVVLFNGSGMDNWRAIDGSAPKWVARDGYMESVPGSGYLRSRDAFGDVQLHVEWAAPSTVKGDGQGRGNSGVFLMGLYEVQVLDSWDNPTYADGQAGSVYGQYPPLVNASRKPGEWQAYDIVFRRPRFRRDGSVESSARLTVFHNGVLVQDNSAVRGPTSWLKNYPYKIHPDKLPLAFQDHGNPVRYRNVWLRELDEWDRRGPAEDTTKPVVTLTEAVLDKYVGTYNQGRRPLVRITREGGQMFAAVYALPPMELETNSETEWSLRWTAAHFDFTLDGSGRPQSVEFHIGGDVLKGVRQ